MKRLNIFLASLSAIVFVAATTSAQQWQQVGSPIGGGITALAWRQSNSTLWATTTSFNYPQVTAGIRSSSNLGASWNSHYNPAFTARTIIVAPADNYIYASVWLFGLQEGLFVSPNGVIWAGPLYLAGANDNIFSVASHPMNPQIMFVGTRNGVVRSTNGGTNWTTVNNGIPANTWVRAMAIDSSGIVAAGTTNGLYISTNNGDAWTRATGINDTVTAVFFDDDTSSTATSRGNSGRLIAGTQDPAGLYQAFADSLYLLFTLLTLFGDGHVSYIGKFWLEQLNREMHGVSVFKPTGSGGGIYFSTDGGRTFTADNQGLPTPNLVSSMTCYASGNTFMWFAGVLENTATGAKVYRKSIVTSVDDNDSPTPTRFELQQNYPNPFNPSTRIVYRVKSRESVSLKVFDVLGREVATLVDEIKNPGEHAVTFDGANLSSGVYFYRMTAGSYVATKKLLLMR